MNGDTYSLCLSGAGRQTAAGRRYFASASTAAAFDGDDGRIRPVETAYRFAKVADLVADGQRPGRKLWMAGGRAPKVTAMASRSSWTLRGYHLTSSIVLGLFVVLHAAGFHVPGWPWYF